MKEKIVKYLLSVGDNAMILGHRLSELCGHGPILETDIALTNISLDLFGQTRNYFQLAARLQNEIDGKSISEDDLAFLRAPNEYWNALLVEYPNKDFAYVIARQFLFDNFHFLLLKELVKSNHEDIAAIAAKSLKEVEYHQMFSSQWIKRLGDGTSESHGKIKKAIDDLYPYTRELVNPGPLEKELSDLGILPDLSGISSDYYMIIEQIVNEATLTTPDVKRFQSGGKNGIHTEYFGYILAELQYMQRAYPEMNW